MFIKILWCRAMAKPTLFPVRTSSLPLIIIFLLLNSLLNQLHSPSYQTGENNGMPEEKGGLVKLLEPKFALHKWAHGYTCSYRLSSCLLSWIHLYIQGPTASMCRLSGQASFVAVRWQNKVVTPVFDRLYNLLCPQLFTYMVV